MWLQLWRTREIWRQTEYKEYFVSNKGRVKSHKFHTTDNKYERILSQNPDRDGYMTCTLYPEKKYIKAKVHRLVAKAFCRGQSKEKKLALHKDGNKENNRATNLYWGTAKDNKADSQRHGTNTQDWTWETAPTRILQPRNVRRIRKLFAKKSITEIANMYDVHYKTIHDIKVGKTWRHILDYT